MRLKYLNFLFFKNNKNSFIIQKFLKGYLIYRNIKNIKQKLILTRMDNVISKLKSKHEIDLFIKLRYFWKKYKIRK